MIGRGEELGIKIGQREQLSAIDIGQIRTMYGCNKKHKKRHEKGSGKGITSCSMDIVH